MVGKTVLVGPGRVAKDTVNRVGIGLFDRAESVLDSLADILDLRPDYAPVSVPGDLEPMLFREISIFLILP